MKTTITNLAILNVKTTPTYGGSKTVVEYELETICENIVNNYIITARVRGLENGNPYLELETCDPTTNNENTLTKEVIETLLGW